MPFIAQPVLMLFHGGSISSQTDQCDPRPGFMLGRHNYSTVKPTPERSLRSVLIVLFYGCVLRAYKNNEMHNKSGK